MPLTLEIRRERWAKFVRQAIRAAQVQQGWSVAEVIKRTGVGKTTLYRWLRGEWDADPRPSLIEQFCDGMGIPTERAFIQLWPGRMRKNEATEPMPIPEDVDLFLRKLNDPKTGEQEKVLMMGMVRSALHLQLDQPVRTRPRRA